MQSVRTSQYRDLDTITGESNISLIFQTSVHTASTTVHVRRSFLFVTIKMCLFQDERMENLEYNFHEDYGCYVIVDFIFVL